MSPECTLKGQESWWHLHRAQGWFCSIGAFGESVVLLVLVGAVATQSASLNAKDTLGSAASPGLVNKWVLFRVAGRLSPPESFPTSSPSGIAGQCVSDL